MDKFIFFFFFYKDWVANKTKQQQKTVWELNFIGFKKMTMDIILELLNPKCLSVPKQDSNSNPSLFLFYIYLGYHTDLLYRTIMRIHQLKNAKHIKTKKAYNMYLYLQLTNELSLLHHNANHYVNYLKYCKFFYSHK